jgi:hypothetical protein
MQHIALPSLLRSSRRVLGGLAATAVVAACAADPGAGSAASEPSPTSAASQSVLGVPGPSPYSFERVGLYVSPADTSGYSFPDPLNGPAGLVSQLGSRVVRIFLSNPDKYTGVPYPSLGAQVLTWPYTALFNSSSFDTYLLTTYSRADNPSNGCAPNWLNGYSGADAQAETAEIQQLALDLAVGYPSKKFILMNWEGDSAIGSLAHFCGIGQTEAMWQGFTAWINARVQGVLDARSQGAANVYSGLEFNAMQRLPGDDFYGNACGPPDASSLTPGCSWCDGAHSCVISRVVPNVPNVDYVSYSSWQSLAVPNDGDVATRLQNDLSRAQGFAPGASRASFVVGEFGVDRFQFGEARAASRMSSAISGFTGWGASYGVYWQVLDNTGGEPGNGFGAWEPSGTTGAVGNMLRGYFGQPVTCSFSAATSIPFNGFWSIAVTSNPAGYSASWYGAHNGAVDAINAFAGTTNLFQSFGPYTNSGDRYTRALILRDGGGNVVCTTNTVTVSIQ